MKRTPTSFATALAAAALATGCAGDPAPEHRSGVGQVQALYVERSPGVFVDHRVSQHGSDTPRWAAVSMREPLADGRRYATAAVDPSTPVEVGDTVEVALEPEANTHEPARITAIVMKRAERAARLNIKGPRWAS